jgi:hypothetical protein
MKSLSYSERSRPQCYYRASWVPLPPTTVGSPEPLPTRYRCGCGSQLALKNGDLSSKRADRHYRRASRYRCPARKARESAAIDLANSLYFLPHIPHRRSTRQKRGSCVGDAEYHHREGDPRAGQLLSMIHAAPLRERAARARSPVSVTRHCLCRSKMLPRITCLRVSSFEQGCEAIVSSAERSTSPSVSFPPVAGPHQQVQQQMQQQQSAESSAQPEAPKAKA